MNFNALFKPKNVAVIGVSLKNDFHPANVIFTKNLLRYRASVFAVGGREAELQGEKVHARISDIPAKIDLAVIATRAESIPGIITECIASGVGGAIIISGGFTEAGRSDLQEEITGLARGSEFPFIGPNCLGVFSPPHIDTFFIPEERIIRPARGNVALVSQSGGLLVDQMIKFARQGIGVSLGVSIGNKAMVGEKDLLGYFAEDPETEVIAFYVESFGRNEGREFLSAAAGVKKPIVVLKAGKSDAGTRAVASHTGAMAGDYDVFSKIFSAGGLLEARDEFEFISFCEALSCFPNLPPISGNIGIITGSGGHGSLAVDDCAAHGLSVPVFSDARREEIRKRVSPRIREIASFRNPIDLTGSAVDDDFMATARHLATLPEIDCILVLLLPYAPGISSDLGARLSQLYRQLGKPMVAYVPQVEKYRILIEGFEINGIPLGHSVQAAVQMAYAMRRRPTW